MKYQIFMIGKLRKGPERELYERYQKRLKNTLSLVEVLPAKSSLEPQLQKEFDAQALTLRLPKTDTFLVALDERGQNNSTQELYQRLLGPQERQFNQVCFLIGGADGHGDNIRHQADLVLQLGALTLPHQLIPALIAEQIYRLESIRTGHPYHRD